MTILRSAMRGVAILFGVFIGGAALVVLATWLGLPPVDTALMRH